MGRRRSKSELARRACERLKRLYGAENLNNKADPTDEYFFPSAEHQNLASLLRGRVRNPETRRRGVEQPPRGPGKPLKRNSRPLRPGGAQSEVDQAGRSHHGSAVRIGHLRPAKRLARRGGRGFFEKSPWRGPKSGQGDYDVLPRQGCLASGHPHLQVGVPPRPHRRGGESAQRKREVAHRLGSRYPQGLQKGFPRGRYRPGQEILPTPPTHLRRVSLERYLSQARGGALFASSPKG